MIIRYKEVVSLDMAHIKVAVYKNLHKNLWSIKALIGPLRGKVILHADAVNLHSCQLRVNEKGRQRVLAEKRKNVHATVEEYLVLSPEYELNSFENPVEAYYNPYKTDVFITKNSGKSLAGKIFPRALLTRDNRLFVD